MPWKRGMCEAWRLTGEHPFLCRANEACSRPARRYSRSSPAQPSPAPARPRPSPAQPPAVGWGRGARMVLTREHLPTATYRSHSVGGNNESDTQPGWAAAAPYTCHQCVMGMAAVTVRLHVQETCEVSQTAPSHPPSCPCPWVSFESFLRLTTLWLASSPGVLLGGGKRKSLGENWKKSIPSPESACVGSSALKIV